MIKSPELLDVLQELRGKHGTKDQSIGGVDCIDSESSGYR
jgi:hypothetical protein